ncbi:MAG: response regulator transcription factor [Desulfobacterota bacterium]|nr:response regulator transcription factor [Thermodesulfobacteriota bacterium]
MNPILVVEDDPDIARLVEYQFRQAGFPIATAPDGTTALEQVKRSKPPLIILDLMLPDMDGKEICRAMKANPSTRSIPILILTAKAEEVDRIVGFELGADDYVTKPFSPKELVLRVKAILNRKQTQEEGETLFEIGDLVIDVERHRVMVGKKPVPLTHTEFKLLVELVSKRGRVLTREVLLDRVWGYTYEGYARTVDTHVRRLRDKLGPERDRIETVRGVGYRFRERDSEEEPQSF